MPYIPKTARTVLDDPSIVATQPGELNYRISKLCNDYLAMNGLSYTSINDLIGALECAKLELYRRIAAPYEDTKAMSNGDVYVFQTEKA